MQMIYNLMTLGILKHQFHKVEVKCPKNTGYICQKCNVGLHSDKIAGCFEMDVHIFEIH